MGLLDKIRALLGGKSTPAKSDPKGPLGLLPGDTVFYYKEKLTLRGTRVLDGEGGTQFQYCLENEEGRPAVLVATGDERPEMSLQRPLEAEIDWNAEQIAGPEDEEFVLEAVETSRVKVYGGVGPHGAKRVTTRRYREDEDEGVLVLEEWGGAREQRIGSAVFEGEIVIGSPGYSGPSGGITAAMQAAEDDEEAAAAKPKINKGSPLAAAMALGDGADRSAQMDLEGDDHDPTAYDDDEWADADFDDDEREPPGSIIPSTHRTTPAAAAMAKRAVAEDPTGDVWHGGHLGESQEVRRTTGAVSLSDGDEDDDEWFDA